MTQDPSFEHFNFTITSFDKMSGLDCNEFESRTSEFHFDEKKTLNEKNSKNNFELLLGEEVNAGDIGDFFFGISDEKNRWKEESIFDHRDFLSKRGALSFQGKGSYWQRIFLKHL